jgi:hypothetical protein
MDNEMSQSEAMAKQGELRSRSMTYGKSQPGEHKKIAL